MSFQGSCWFTPTANFLRLGPLDQANYNFYSESIEVGMRQWMSGGRVVINKATWYAHYHKGNNNLHTSTAASAAGSALARRQAAIRSVRDGLLDQRPDGRTRRGRSRGSSSSSGRCSSAIPTDERWPADWNDPKHRSIFSTGRRTRYRRISDESAEILAERLNG
jgi:hypothetical protein